MLHGAHQTAFGAAIVLNNAIQTAHADARARAVASRDVEVNRVLAAQVIELRRRLVAAEAARDSLARALARI